MRWAMVLLFFGGLAYSLAVPMFESPDEPAHFARAYGIAEGQFVLRDSPRHLVVFIRETLQKHHHSEMVSLMDQLMNDYPGRVKLIAPNTAMYSPIPYIIHATIIKSVTIFGETEPLLALSVYLCRIASLTLFLSALYLVIKISPFLFWPVFWIAATPMALSQSAMVNLDFVILGACLILLAVSLGETSFSSFFCLASVSAFVLFLTKPPYAPVLLIPLTSVLWNIQRIGRLKVMGVVMGVILIPFLGAATWNGLMVSQGLMSDYRDLLERYANLHIDPLAQLAYIQAYPEKFIQLIWNTLANQGGTYWHQFVGILGWQDTPIPFGAVVLWTIVVVTAVGITGQTNWDYHFRLLMGIACILVSLLLVIAIFASAYMVWMPVAADAVIVQGRYFHPAAAVFWVGLALVVSRENWKLPLFHPRILLGTACLIHVISIVTLLRKYA